MDTKTVNGEAVNRRRGDAAECGSVPFGRYDPGDTQHNADIITMITPSGRLKHIIIYAADERETAGVLAAIYGVGCIASNTIIATVWRGGVWYRYYKSIAEFEAYTPKYDDLRQVHDDRDIIELLQEINRQRPRGTPAYEYTGTYCQLGRNFTKYRRIK